MHIKSDAKETGEVSNIRTILTVQDTYGETALHLANDCKETQKFTIRHDTPLIKASHKLGV